MFVVLENNKPAMYPDGPECWRENEFPTQEEANEYAHHWLEDWAKGIPAILELGTRYDYNGYGDIIEIREIPMDTHAAVRMLSKMSEGDLTALILGAALQLTFRSEKYGKFYEGVTDAFYANKEELVK